MSIFGFGMIRGIKMYGDIIIEFINNNFSILTINI